MSRNMPNRRLRLEQLEDRRLLAGGLATGPTFAGLEDSHDRHLQRTAEHRSGDNDGRSDHRRGERGPVPAREPARHEGGRKDASPPRELPVSNAPPVNPQSRGNIPSNPQEPLLVTRLPSAPSIDIPIAGAISIGEGTAANRLPGELIAFQGEDFLRPPAVGAADLPEAANDVEFMTQVALPATGVDSSTRSQELFVQGSESEPSRFTNGPLRAAVDAGMIDLHSSHWLDDEREDQEETLWSLSDSELHLLRESVHETPDSSDDARVDLALAALGCGSVGLIDDVVFYGELAELIEDVAPSVAHSRLIAMVGIHRSVEILGEQVANAQAATRNAVLDALKRERKADSPLREKRAMSFSTATVSGAMVFGIAAGWLNHERHARRRDVRECERDERDKSRPS